MARPFYRVITTDQADDELAGLSPLRRRRVRAAMRALADDYRAEGAKPLVNQPDLWSVRVGGLRVVFRLERADRIVRVTRVRPRETAYDGIERPPRSRR